MGWYRTIVVAAAILALGVVVLGAYVRLSDAGLGCPDWPGCYGKLIGVPDTARDSAMLQAYPDRPLEAHKAWKEMIHRYFAAALGLLILAIFWRSRSQHDMRRTLASALLGIVAIQATLGMLTVTLLLKPLIVTSHLLGGMTTLALLVALTQWRAQAVAAIAAPALRTLAVLGLVAVGCQIALGGWVSSNYAALACVDFPTCNGQWYPAMDMAGAFELHRELGQAAAGSPLTLEALRAIHWSHRFGALTVAIFVGALGIMLFRDRRWRRWGAAIGSVLAIQIALGIGNVMLALPLPLAVAHNAGAAMLLSLLVGLNCRIHCRPAN